jgi:hypothetical protein
MSYLPTFSRVYLLLLVLSLPLLILACGDGDQVVAGVTSGVDPAVSHLRAGDSFSAEAPLRGEEVVPPVDTQARGLFRLSTSAEDRAEFALELEGVGEVTSVELRSGPPGSEGPLLATLYSQARDGSSLPTAARLTDEVLAGGKLEGEGLDALLSLLPTGETYVEVKTRAHEEGELRGQLRVQPGTVPLIEQPEPPPAAPAPQTHGPQEGAAPGGDAAAEGRGRGQDRNDDKQRGPDKGYKDDDKDEGARDADKGKGAQGKGSDSNRGKGNQGKGRGG